MNTNTTAGLQRIELSLKKINETSDDTLQAVPISSACTSGCFSSVSSIEVKSGNGMLDEMQLDAVIRMNEKSLDVAADDSSFSSLHVSGPSLHA